MSEQVQRLWVRSILASRTRQGQVCIELNDQQIAQLTLDEARDFARNLAAAIEAAQSDEFLFSFLTNRLEVPLEAAGAAMTEFRQMRQAMGTSQ